MILSTRQGPVKDGEDIIVNRVTIRGEDKHYIYVSFGCVGPEQQYITKRHREMGMAEDVITTNNNGTEVVTVVDGVDIGGKGFNTSRISKN